jgi:hypothetical protein
MVCVDGIHSDVEQQRMRSAGLQVVDVEESASRPMASWQSVNQAVNAGVVIDHDLSNDDMACAYFTGPDRVILATQLVSIVNYLPTELLHMLARGTSPAAQRRGALSVLAQIYVATSDEWRWDQDIEATVTRCRTDADADVRWEALGTEIQGNPAAAANHLRDERDRVSAPHERVRLTKLLDLAERAATEFPTATSITSGSMHLAGEHLAVPIYRVGPTANVIRRLNGVAEVVSERAVETAGGTGEVTELRAIGIDAGLTYVTVSDSPVGGAYFFGRDRIRLACGIAWAVQYFPIHLAKLAAAFGQLSEVRTLALSALAFASSQRMDPAIEVDPTVPGILAAAVSDADPAVRNMATGVEQLLRNEIERN